MSLLMDALKTAEQTKKLDAIDDTKTEPETTEVKLSINEIEPLDATFLPSPEIKPIQTLSLETTKKQPAKTQKIVEIVPSKIPTETPQPEEQNSTPEPEPSPITATIPNTVSKKKTNQSYLWGGLIILMAAVGFTYYALVVLAATTIETPPPPLLDWQPETALVNDDIALFTPDTTSKNNKEKINNSPIPSTPKQPAAAIIAKPVKTIKASQPQPIKHQTIAAKEHTQPPQTKITIQRNQTEDPIHKLLQQAYASYQAGEANQADERYRLVLRRENNNRDALLGRAIIAQGQSHTTDARRFYRRLLQLNPKDSVALTGLMSLPQQGASNHNVSHLKVLLDEEPSAAHLHFALGNEYANQKRWPEAQQAYFNAYRHNPADANYAFNLAVSLEHIGQPQAALNYYRHAVDTHTQKNSFDRQQLNQRITQLAQQVNTP